MAASLEIAGLKERMFPYSEVTSCLLSCSAGYRMTSAALDWAVQSTISQQNACSSYEKFILFLTAVPKLRS